MIKDLTLGNERKMILLFALPMLIGNVFQQLYNVVDSIVVGNYLGVNALSAVGASGPIFFALISLIIGLASGVWVVVSQYFGAKDYNKVKLGVDTLFVIMFVASFIVSFLGIFFIDEILELIKLPAEIKPQAKSYLTIVLIGLIADFGYNGTAAILRSLGDSKTPLYFLIFSTLINIILDLFFVIVLKMGVEGVAYATVLSKLGAFISAIIYINKKHEFLNISLLNLSFDKKIFFKSLRIGLPTGFQQMFVAVGMMAVFSIVNGFGTAVIAAYSVAGRIDLFAMMPAMNFSQALGTFTGQNIGAGKINRVGRGLKATILMSSGVSIVLSFIAIFFGHFFMGFFTPDAEVIKIGAGYLKISGAAYLLFSILFSFMGVFRGAGASIVPMFITLFALWVIRIPLSYYLSVDFAETGVWYAIPISWAVGATASLIYYFYGNWRDKSVLKK